MDRSRRQRRFGPLQLPAEPLFLQAVAVGRGELESVDSPQLLDFCPSGGLDEHSTPNYPAGPGTDSSRTSLSASKQRFEEDERSC